MVDFLALAGQNTQPASINAAGEITGTVGQANQPQGFLLRPDGTIIIFNPKNSTGTVPCSINDAGIITGFYVKPNNVGVGFVRLPWGAFTLFGKSNVNFIFPFSINDVGEIAGYYQDNVWTTSHGFLFLP